MHQMHCPTYPPSYYTYSQHPRDMCYSPPYQSSYYPPKVYPTAYRHFMPTASGYYQPPTELYEPPGTMQQPTVSQAPSQSIVQSSAEKVVIQPQPQQMQAPSGQLIPTMPNGQQHIEHYSPYYPPGYSSGGGCYTRSIQPPFMGKQKYENCIHSHTFS